MRRVTIVGGNGNMGRRYGAICRDVGVEVVVVDVNTAGPSADTDGFIVATPTPTHVEVVENLLKFKRPILCEKPVTTDADVVRSLCREAKARDVPFDVVMQYRELMKFPSGPGPFISAYDYWNHGKDGLHWDCFQILALGEGPCFLGETSPFWSCVLNNHRLSIADMDEAYWRHITRWMAFPQQRADYVANCHDKVHSIIVRMKKGEYGVAIQ